MKKISLKTAVAAVSLSLALVPVGFAQSPAATPVAATKNTQPLPGARIASQVEAGALFAGGALTTTGIVVGVVAIAAVAGIVAQQNANQDDLLQQLLASGVFTINASGQLSQVR